MVARLLQALCALLSPLLCSNNSSVFKMVCFKKPFLSERGLRVIELWSCSHMNDNMYCLFYLKHFREENEWWWIIPFYIHVSVSQILCRLIAALLDRQSRQSSQKLEFGVVGKRCSIVEREAEALQIERHSLQCHI